MQQGQSSDINQPAAKRAKIVPQGMMLTDATEYQVISVIVSNPNFITLLIVPQGMMLTNATEYQVISVNVRNPNFITLFWFLWYKINNNDNRLWVQLTYPLIFLKFYLLSQSQSWPTKPFISSGSIKSFPPCVIRASLSQ
jgi:hypothetical protein